MSRIYKEVLKLTYKKTSNSIKRSGRGPLNKTFLRRRNMNGQLACERCWASLIIRVWTPLPIPHPASFLCFPSEENLWNDCDDSLFPFPHISVSFKTSPIISFVPFIALEWLWSRFPVPKPGTSASSHESNQQRLVWVAAPPPGSTLFPEPPGRHISLAVPLHL